MVVLNLEQGSVASDNSVKRTGYEPFSKSMATYLTATYIRHQGQLTRSRGQETGQILKLP